MGFRYNWKRGGGETENESVIGSLSYFSNFVLEAPCTLNLRTKASSNLGNISTYTLEETSTHTYKLLLQKSQQRWVAASFHWVFPYIAI